MTGGNPFSCRPLSSLSLSPHNALLLHVFSVHAGQIPRRTPPPIRFGQKGTCPRNRQQRPCMLDQVMTSCSLGTANVRLSF